MNSTRNKKIEQVKETTMIVGIDIGSEKHYFRAFNWRGIELTRKPVAFSNSMEGFNSFYNTIVELIQKSELEEALVGIEPTGHYWFDLGQFMGEKNIKFVMVNPHHVHKSKELDDNSPSKNDRKDPRVIAGLVRDGRYFYSYMPTGVYAELRNASNRRFVLVEEQTRAKNRLQKWIAVYFPEYKGIYTRIDAKGGLLVLKQAPTPEEIVRLGVEGIIKIWKDAKLRGNGHKKAMLILNAAMKSIGLKAGLTEARMEIQDLIEDYELQTKRLERVNDLIKELCQQIRYADKLLEIKGIGITTIAGFIAEVGDITRFDSAKELQKLAGLELVADSSGKHNGKTKISKRGRKRLRYLLFEAAISVVGKNEEFKEIHRMEIQDLIEDYELQTKRLERVNDLIKELCQQIRYADKLLEIKGIGITTIAGFIAEVGDITRFDSAKELQKLAGLELVADSSGKHNGKTKISKRGRKRLRYLLFEAAISVVGKNEEFKEIHRYYTTREKNPLKKMQSLIAVACKLIRVFHVILTKGISYDASKMLKDIQHPGEPLKAA